MKARLSALVASLALVLAATGFSQNVHVAVVDATINPATADYIHSAIEQAFTDHSECLIIQLNTPGGLLKSTRVIVTDLLTAQVPVVVYVSPSGSQSASAGSFITLAAHIAAMAPGTNIGAAHPVTMQGQERDSIMNEKATNDAAAFIRTISEKRHRNVRWAEDAVRKSISITETEALRDSVVDLIARDIPDLLRAIDGKSVTVGGEQRLLHSSGARIVNVEMGWKYTLLDILSDPNIAYIFFLLGIYGLMFELYNPGSVLPGVVGSISLILAFYSMHTLPVNYAGVALILVGIVLFVLEIKIVSHGLLAVGGIVALFLGSVMLINTESPLEFVSLSLAVIIPSVLVTAFFFLFLIGLGLKAQRKKPATGIEGLTGEEGIALSNISPNGQVRVHGEIWNADTSGDALPSGTHIRVTGVTNLILHVVKDSH